MIEQLNDSGFTGGGVVAGTLTSNEKQQSVVVKKQPLRDLPNENNVIITKSTVDSPLPKERVAVNDPDKISGVKRLSSEVNPPLSQVPSTANTNGNLVYVRRKIEAEVGKISSSGTTGNNSNTDLLLSVKASVSNERVQPSSIPNKPQTDAGSCCHSSAPSLNPPTMPINTQNESQLPDPQKSGNNMPASKDTCLLPHPAEKSGNTISTPDNKAAHPVGVSGNTVPSVENKSPHPHPLGISGNSTVSTDNKSTLYPLGKSGDTMSSAENKSQASNHLENSDIIKGSAEIRSPLPHPVGNSGVCNSSVEDRSPSLGKSGNIMPSADNSHIPPVTTKLDFTKESNNKHLQHQQVQPRISLRGLDRSAHEEYLQMLRSLSSVELSRLAVELETRAIQLSLEEAREIARTEMLNVMGKSSKASKSPSALP